MAIPKAWLSLCLALALSTGCMAAGHVLDSSPLIPKQSGYDGFKLVRTVEAQYTASSLFCVMRLDGTKPIYVKLMKRLHKRARLRTGEALVHMTYDRTSWWPLAPLWCTTVHTLGAQVVSPTGPLGVSRAPSKTQGDIGYRARLRQQCNEARASACAELGMLFYQGLQGPKDLVVSNQFLEKACDGGHAVSCHDLAVSFEEGTGVAEDKARAHELYKKACAAGDFGSCSLAP